MLLQNDVVQLERSESRDLNAGSQEIPATEFPDIWLEVMIDTAKRRNQANQIVCDVAPCAIETYGALALSGSAIPLLFAHMRERRLKRMRPTVILRRSHKIKE